MRFAALALLLGALLSLSEAVCMFIDLKPGTTHCMDHWDKTWHAMGSEWTNSQCWDCTCTQCCQNFNVPIGFPGYCVSVFNLDICEYEVYKKDDPSVLCPVYGGKLGK